MSIAGSRNVRTSFYKKQLAALPEQIQTLSDKLFRRFLDDPAAPELNNHPLDDTHRGRHRNGSRAVSITRRYRAVYVVDGDTNVWYWVGSHEDYNNFTGKK